MDDNALLSSQAERLQNSGILGEARLRKLFDYLLGCTLEGRSPKEITIAMEAFGRGADFDVSQDALVRVYVHKLRRALADFYAASGNDGGPALQIPKGEYRLRVISAKAAADIEPVAVDAPRRMDRQWLAACGVATAGVLALIGA